MAFVLRNVFQSYKQKPLQKTFLIVNQLLRANSTITQQLVYEDYGDPVKVVQPHEVEVKPPVGSEVLVKILAAPVNPADINLIQGKYPAKVHLPAVAGNEGVGEVVAVGDAVKNFEPGDRVIPLKQNLGTWQTHTTLPSDVLYKVPREIGVVEAATLTVNPCTAYRMLEDFVKVEAGATVIQNGGNSAVGQNVIQICKARDIKTVNIVRDRPDIGALKKFLTDLGATHVLTEQEVRTFRFDKSIKKPKLAFNCVGGKNALEMLRHIDHNGVMVTYGGMSREPVTIPTSALIFKNIRFVGFWMTQWSKDNHDSEERWKMFEELIKMIRIGELHAPIHKLVPFKNYKEALQNTISISGFTGQKYILDLGGGVKK